MIQLPSPVIEGRPVSAQWLNSLLAAVRSLATISAGPGLNLTHGPTGLLLALAIASDDSKPGVIVAAPPGPHQPAESIRYDVRVVGYDRIETGLEARIGRIVSGQARIVPALVGDPCRIYTVANGDGTFTAFLWAMTETLATTTCTDEPITP